MAAEANTHGTDEARGRAWHLLRRHGRHALSFLILEPTFSYWFDGDEACIGYFATPGAWVAGGTPVARRERTEEVMTRFTQAAMRAKKRVRFFAVEPDAVSDDFAQLPIGARPVWNPQNWESTLRAHRNLRRTIQRARGRGVSVRRLATEELVNERSSSRQALDRLISRWIRGRRMPAMGFLVDVHPYGFPAERQAWVAEKDGRMVGFLGMVPIYGREGWLFEDLLRDPEAPNGIAELLVDAGMRQVAAEGCRFATLGLVPLANVRRGWLRWIRDHTGWLYDFHGLRAFKAKLHPEAWEPLVLAFPKGDSEVRAVLDALAAFARGSFVRFGLKTAVHAAPLTARILGALLIPWTALLAMMPHWFPSRPVQWSWVAFDLGMTVGLFALARSWRRSLAMLLAGLAAADAGLTLVEMVTYNLPRTDGPLAWGLMLAGLIAPIGAAAFLWRARGHPERGRYPPAARASTAVSEERSTCSSA